MFTSCTYSPCRTIAVYSIILLYYGLAVSVTSSDYYFDAMMLRNRVTTPKSVKRRGPNQFQ